MPELTREEKLKLIEKLPERLQNFLYSEDTGAVLLYFEKKYNISGEKSGSLSRLVADIVLGITPITSLAQEINLKVISDAQAAMNLAQELNTELLAQVIAPAPLARATPVPVPTPAAIPPRPIAPPTALTPAAKPIAPAAPRADQYRELVVGGPEIIDLRKTPPPSMPMPVSPAPIPPSPPKPLTFTKPVEPVKPVPPLIRAEPNLPAKISPEISTDKMTPIAPKLPEKPAVDLSRPQYIIRPSGLAPTDSPRDVLDLRKDKGEF